MRITVITTVRNAVRTIDTCLESVARQKRISPAGRMFEVEHVVVDGASTDGTLEKVWAFPAPVYLVSEPDRGIYDGMNRGVRLASGEVVGFLNADDFYWNPYSLGQVVDGLQAEVDAAYGNVVYVRAKTPDRVIRVWRAGRMRRSSWRRGWMPPHPSLFVRRSLFDRYGRFRLDLGSAADYEWMLRVFYVRGAPAAQLERLWVAMRAGGASGANFKARLHGNRLDLAAWQLNGVAPATGFRLLKPLRKLPQYLRLGARPIRRDITRFLASERDVAR